MEEPPQALPLFGIFPSDFEGAEPLFLQYVGQAATSLWLRPRTDSFIKPMAHGRLHAIFIVAVYAVYAVTAVVVLSPIDKFAMSFAPYNTIFPRCLF